MYYVSRELFHIVWSQLPSFYISLGLLLFNVFTYDEKKTREDFIDEIVRREVIR